ncbi:MAG TPA: HAD-IIA family hydrolase [Acidimicrobiia bacterium]|nr:HAD-IIA family hydrolase [Acidimicrobiia bacterium]
MSAGIVLDLDGVVYRGSAAVPGAAEGLSALADAGFELHFVTNNSARAPGAVAERIASIVGYPARPDQIVTSSLVAASMIEEGPVLMMGESGLEVAIRAAGFETTEDPNAARTVVVGLDRNLSYERAAAAADAARAGARLIVTNRDPTFPIEDGGLKPGAGACAALVETAAGVVGETAGKPSAAMRRLVERRIPEGTIWMVGDRPDTDIALAAAERWKSILVLTGVTSDPTTVDPAPDFVAADLKAAADIILAAEAEG